MQRGNLVIFDTKGIIFSQTGEADGSVLPHVLPVGIPYIEVPFGTMVTKRLVGIDISNGIENAVPILEDIPQKTQEEIIMELQTRLLAYEAGEG